MNTNKKKYVKSLIDKKSLGLEIGPSYNPLASKADGFNVKVLDHLTETELKKKYTDHFVNTENIETVDYVWTGQPYADVTGGEAFNWIIASHVIEHSVDLIGFLNQCESILAKKGLLILAVPDKRRCFDRFRPISSTGNVIDKALLGYSTPSPGAVFDTYATNVRKNDGAIAWGDDNPGDYTLAHGIEESCSMYACSKDGEYIDVHSWCFTPSSFQLILQDLLDLSLIKFCIKELTPMPGYEFLCVLTNDLDSYQRVPRLDLLKNIEMDLQKMDKISKKKSWKNFFKGK